METHYTFSVPFRDVDMHGHMHNAAYVSHFEAALSSYLDANGLSEFFAPDGDKIYVVRRVDVTYDASCHYGDDLEVSVQLKKLGQSSLCFTAVMHAGQADVRSKGEIIWVCIDRATKQPCAIPTEIRQALEALGV